MTEFNPFKPPESDVSGFHPNLNDNNGVTRHGKKNLFVPKESDLPPRCIKCNNPVTAPMTAIKFYATRYYSFLTIIIGILVLILIHKLEFFIFIAIIGMVVEVFTQNKSEVYAGLCDLHISKRRKKSVFWFVVFLFGMISASFIYSKTHIPVLLRMAIYCAPISLIGYYFSCPPLKRIIRCKKIDKKGTYVTGFSKDFLQSFAYPTKNNHDPIKNKPIKDT